MKSFLIYTKRNIKLFFHDKGMFLTSLITPLILLVLYATFLGNIYRDNFMNALPDGLDIPSKIFDSLVGGQLVSSILAVSCVTVAFCTNFLMVQDKSNKTIKDILISPKKPYLIAFSYYLGSFVAALLICYTALIISFAYLAIIGWYFTLVDALLLIVDIFLLVLFGTALSSIINLFLTTQGQMSAVGTIVSAGYGFICGAYMPLSSFDSNVKNIFLFLPGTYGTSLVRNHSLNGSVNELAKYNVPESALTAIKDSLDCNLYFFDNHVSIELMYLVLVLSTIVLLAIYVILTYMLKDRIFKAKS